MPDGRRGGLDEVGSVLGVPDRRRGHHADPVDPQLVHGPAKLLQHVHRPGDGLGRQRVVAVHALAQPGDPHEPDQLATVRVGHQEPGGVGAAVDRRHRASS